MSSHAPKRAWFSPTLKVLLVDEDPLFRSQMQRAAASRGWALTAHARLGDFDLSRAAQDYDVVVLNAYLEEVRYGRHEAAERTLGSLPAVLVSHFKAEEESRWPASVRRFARKADGCDAILETALTAAQARGGGSLLGRIKVALKR